jgi:ribosome assembly protein RRB1
MSKRHRDSDALREEPGFLKSGDRPIREDGDEALEFEDEFEDEYESEDDIFEAGVDGRPDAEREAEEQGVRASALLPKELCADIVEFKMQWM